jgi:hypothetical protein
MCTEIASDSQVNYVSNGKLYLNYNAYRNSYSQPTNRNNDFKYSMKSIFYFSTLMEIRDDLTHQVIDLFFLALPKCKKIRTLNVI